MVELRLMPARSQAPLANEPFHEWTFPDGTPWTAFYRTNCGYLLRFVDLADFQVSADARDVVCFPAPDVSEATSEHLYLNQVLPLVFSKLGKLVFHASAVEIDGGAVAFPAESGRGKSTLAASFAVSGFRLLSDDGLFVETGAHGFDVMPTDPSIRLWADSSEALMTPGLKTAPALDFTSKARFLAGERLAFCDNPRPLRRAYFLGNGSATTLALQRLSPSEALMEWVKHSFLLDVHERPRLASHFDQLARLAIQPIHYRLDYPRRFEDLAGVGRAIVEHACEGSHAA